MKQERTDEEWDALLKIQTSGDDDMVANHINFPYEPTAYSVLMRIAEEGYITEKDCLLDYGCGKGRVDFFMTSQTGCYSIGVDYDKRMIRFASDNQKHFKDAERVKFVFGNATTYDVPSEVNRIYFFNPFSEVLLEGTLEKIYASWYENPREILLFFYYPSNEYIGMLMQQDEMTFFDEISCDDLFPDNRARERVLIFRMEEM